MQTDVVHPPFTSDIHTPPMYARATHGQSHSNQSNVTAPVRIPHFAGQAAHAHGNPSASALTSTQNTAEVAQPAMNMPQYTDH